MPEKFCEGEIPSGSVWDPCPFLAEPGRRYCHIHSTRYGEDDPVYAAHVLRLRLAGKDTR